MVALTKKYLKEIADIKYTALLEEKFDLISDVKASKLTTLSNFDNDFDERIGAIKEKYKLPDLGKCPKCSSALIERTGKYGKFLGCSSYPKCKFIKKAA